MFDLTDAVTAAVLAKPDEHPAEHPHHHRLVEHMLEPWLRTRPDLFACTAPVVLLAQLRPRVRQLRDLLAAILRHGFGLRLQCLLFGRRQIPRLCPAPASHREECQSQVSLMSRTSRLGGSAGATAFASWVTR